jgi:hypothetical protein
MATPQINPSNILEIGGTVLRSICNRGALLAASGLIVIGAIAASWNWLVAAGVASVLLSILPCLVMCGLGLCMHKFIGRSGSASGSAVTEQSEISTGAAVVAPAAYVASCCGAAAGSKLVNVIAESPTELKENTHA